jgi:hypothetical protein
VTAKYMPKNVRQTTSPGTRGKSSTDASSRPTTRSASRQMAKSSSEPVVWTLAASGRTLGSRVPLSVTSIQGSLKMGRGSTTRDGRSRLMYTLIRKEFGQRTLTMGCVEPYRRDRKRLFGWFVTAEQAEMSFYKTWIILG